MPTSPALSETPPLHATFNPLIRPYLVAMVAWYLLLSIFGEPGKAWRGGIGYVDLGGGKEYEATGVISDRWETGIGEIGAVISGSYYERTMATDNFETDFETVSRDLRPVGSNEDPNGLINIGGTNRRVWARETENKLYRLTRKNYSVSGRLEWAPDSDNKLFVTSIYSAFTDNELRSNFIFDLDESFPNSNKIFIYSYLRRRIRIDTWYRIQDNDVREFALDGG